MKLEPISLAELSSLAAEQIAAEREVAKKEAELSVAKGRLRTLAEESVPAAMLELELDKIKLASGDEITVKQDVYASISEERKDEAFAWLEERNYGGVIKTVVAVEFSKGEMDIALAFFEKLRKTKLSVKVSIAQPPKIVKGRKVKTPPKLVTMRKQLEPTFARSVNPQTLKALLRELLETGSSDIPLDTFAARPVWVAKVKSPKLTEQQPSRS